MSIFGRILTEDQIEDAVVDVLKKWIPTYLSEVERQVGVTAGTYKRPPSGSYIVRPDFEKWPEEHLPVIIVLNEGSDDDAAKEGRGIYRQSWLIGVAGVVSSIDQISTRRYAYRLGAAIRGVLAQHASLDGGLDGTVRGVDWVGGRNNELPSEDGRTLWATRQLFSVEIGDVLTKPGGPVSPDAEPLPDPTDPYPDWATVPDEDHVQPSYTKEPIQ